MKLNNLLIISIGIVFIGVSFLGYLFQQNKYLSYSQTVVTQQKKIVTEKKFIVTHIKTPKKVKAIYMTSWVAGTPSIRKNLVSLIKETELNSVVIDIKDYSGKIAFIIDDERISEYKSEENRISDVKEFIGKLHDNGIYVIGRIVVFQDPYLTTLRPDLAVQKGDGSVWKDYKGSSFTDPGFKEVWDYHVALSQDAYKFGFDELNFDYIRYPSDGDMNDIYYPKTEERIVSNPDTGKSEVLEEFFSYLNKNLKNTGVVTSADLFGMTTTNYDDLNIGQVLEKTLPYFDYVSPMVYPSHYPPTFIGFQNPAEHPYEVVKYSLDEGIKRTIIASTSPNKLRPWLQDFSLSTIYTPDLVRAQINATEDTGLSSWMLWNASNNYTKKALKPFYTKEASTSPQM